jgi:hypothetical protein
MDIARVPATLGLGNAEVAVARAVQVLLFRLGRDPVLRTCVDAGRQEFLRVARAELRGFGLSAADLDRVLDLVRRQIA